MYVNNVRDAIRSLNDIEYEKYLSKLRLILKKKYSKNVKPSVLKQRVDEFVSGGNPKIDYFECYLLTFDDLFKDGAINALQSPAIKMPKVWKELMIIIMDDWGLPPQIVKELDDEQVLIEIKKLFYNSIEHCKGENKEQFRENLHAFNNFLRIRT
ncbi:hypothetical protein [Bacillus sp. NH11B]|uniref:hypothetical protein n=1 Tax=Bacillus sp. NH11B TaxID=1866314 RepID=UPI0008FD977E|nr:hypothetical protein [Bacillus sp. NH11B]OJD60903.1 hypothetical protein BAU27_13470 [Bacillus sp. NH11B]